MGVAAYYSLIRHTGRWWATPIATTTRSPLSRRTDAQWWSRVPLIALLHSNGHGSARSDGRFDHLGSSTHECGNSRDQLSTLVMFCRRTGSTLRRRVSGAGCPASVLGRRIADGLARTPAMPSRCAHTSKSARARSRVSCSPSPSWASPCGVATAVAAKGRGAQTEGRFGELLRFSRSSAMGHVPARFRAVDGGEEPDVSPGTGRGSTCHGAAPTVARDTGPR